MVIDVLNRLVMYVNPVVISPKNLTNIRELSPSFHCTIRCPRAIILVLAGSSAVLLAKDRWAPCTKSEKVLLPLVVRWPMLQNGAHLRA